MRANSKYRFLAFLVFGLLSLGAHSQSWEWANRMGGFYPDPNNFSPDETIRDMKLDSQGNVYVCGRIGTSGNVGGSSITTFGGYDVFIAK